LRDQRDAADGRGDVPLIDSDVESFGAVSNSPDGERLAIDGQTSDDIILAGNRVKPDDTSWKCEHKCL